MALSKSSSSRLTSLKTSRLNRSKQPQPHSQSQSQQNISEYLRRNDPLPASARPAPAPTPPKSLPEVQSNPNTSLNGVIACLDVRTEDGDDVSLNFERALQSMGAKTRRTFSDSITHLIFKNGSPTTLKKAMNKNIYIVSLLWISSCKRQGKRVPEADFVIDKTQGLLATTGKRRRKSMEPGKVRALAMNDLIHPSLSSSSEGSTHEDTESRRKTIASCSWEARDFQYKDREPKKRVQLDFDEDPLDGLPAEIKLKEPRLSLPASLQNIKYEPTIIPVHAPSLEKTKQIKARFSIGKSTEEETPITLKPTATPSPSPLKRRRRLTGNLTRVINTDAIQSEPTKYVIVLTSVPVPVRKQCEEAIQKFNHFELSTEVTESTTHVLVGVNRRTKSVTMGLLRGIWMLSPEWLLKSGEKNEIESEKEYELSNWYPPSEFRRHQLLLPPSVCIQVLSTTSGTELVEEMVKMAGGSVAKLTEKANLIISDKSIETDKTVVTDTWLFESIEKWRYLDTDAFILNKEK